MKTIAEALGLENLPEQPSSEKSLPLSAKTFSKGILNSEEYRASIRRRVITDTLPPAVECKLYEYAYGKPVDSVEVKTSSDTLSELTVEQLEAKALALALLARKLRDGVSVH